MPYIVLALAGLAGLLLLLKVVATMPPAQLVRGVVIGGTLVGIGTVVFLILAGREALAFGLAGLAIPLLRRWRHYFWGAAPAAGAAGQSSDVTTSWLAMHLDHASGQIGGTVVKGVQAGRRLADLTLEELVALWRGMATEDPPSARLLEAYLDRVHEGWRGNEAGPVAAGGAMDRAEALRILGLEGEPDEAAVRAAHHRLMLANHPDRGGSAYLAAKINQARDRLLARH
jgi:hypothetical protein